MPSALTAGHLMGQDSGRTLSLRSMCLRGKATDPLMQGPTRMADLILGVALEYARKRGFGDLTDSRPRIATWLRRISDLPSMKATAPP